MVACEEFVFYRDKKKPANVQCKKKMVLSRGFVSYLDIFAIIKNFQKSDLQ